MRLLSPFIVVVLCGWHSIAAAETLAEARQALDSAYQTKLQSLAEKWNDRGDGEEAKQTRAWFVPMLDRRIVLFPTTRPLELRGSRPKIAADWEAEFAELRKTQAAALFTLAEQRAKNEPAAAYRLLHEVLREDPEHAPARKALGHQLLPNKRWLTELGPVPEIHQSTINHSTLGWNRGKYWRIESAHFSIATSHSPAEGIYLADELERLHNVWRQVCYSIISRPGALAARLNGSNEPLFKERKHKVVLFRDRDEYLAMLGPVQPKIGLTTGIYYDKDQTTYFYAAGAGKKVADQPTLRTPWLHEVTHQLLQEYLSGNPGEKANFWLVEGIATYFESLTYYPTYATLGGWQADRLQFARYRNLSGDRTWPLLRMMSLGKSEWQESPAIRRIYTQAAGMTSLLMDSEQGRYREPTLTFLANIYQGTDRPEQLAELTKRSYDEFDAAFLPYVQITDADITQFPPHSSARNLSLGLTKITDAGLKQIGVCRDLEWLDLTRTAVTDEGLTVLASFPKLKQLFLERTSTTASSLPLIAKLKDLEELDLTGWKITDDDVKNLSGLANLKVLHLTDTPITDRGLVHLKSLRKLETLETEGTQVTPAGRKLLSLKAADR